VLSGQGKDPPDLARWWDTFLETALKRQLLKDLAGMRPRPCSGRLVNVHGAKGPVAAFVTEFLTSEVDFDHAVRFLNPVVWEQCMPDFWCEMKKLKSSGKGGATRFHEVVSSDCDDRPGASFNAETELDFAFWTLPEQAAPEVAIANYQMSEGRPHERDLILLDEGSLVVAKTGGGQRPLLIITTKRVEFDYAFSSEMLAVIMCAFGYADVSADLLCCAASNADAAAGGRKVGAKFPGISPAAPTRSAPGAGAQRARPSRESAKPDAVSSNVADLFENSADMWIRMLRSGARAIERGAEDVRPASSARPRRRSEG
jgi:hypothetical protein